ncbi:hypothetical protein D5S17_34080 [Pseudonocardiaceae bacterium YIM PH 21723]|nr:hypothetical protein D5S17_34080 [Pseudonocardiaceae bacterium YIM PH 21723]
MLKRLLPAVLALTALAMATPAQAEGRHDTYGPVARMLVDGEGRCTATLIAPEWILTSNMCIPGTGLSGMTFAIGSHRTSTANAVSVSHSRQADLALIKLDRAVGNPVAKLASSTPEVGSTVRTYSWSHACETGTEPTHRTTTPKAVDHSYDYLGSDYFSGPAMNLTAKTGEITCGDYGSPTVHDGEQVGVISLSDGKWTIATLVADQRPWIQEIAGV